jgi:hypothetical protein
VAKTTRGPKPEHIVSKKEISLVQLHIIRRRPTSPVALFPVKKKSKNKVDLVFPFNGSWIMVQVLCVEVVDVRDDDDT